MSHKDLDCKCNNCISILTISLQIRCVIISIINTCHFASYEIEFQWENHLSCQSKRRGDKQPLTFSLLISWFQNHSKCSCILFVNKYMYWRIQIFSK